MRERPLTDYEIRMLRGMMDEYTQKRSVDRWFAIRGKKIAVAIGSTSALAVLAASVLQLVRAL